MKPFHLYIFSLFSIAFTGCVEEERMCCGLRETDVLSGSWLLYESGYSPGGSEYITVDVPSEPAQIITFNAGKVESSVEGFKEVKYYSVLMDTTLHTPYLALYTENPDQVDTPDPASTYLFSATDAQLQLHFRWCIEGCHSAFKKIDNN